MLQLAPHWLTGLAETALTEIIALDPAAQSRLQRLNGRQLAFQLTEFDWRLVLTATKDSIALNLHQEAVDCAIRASLSSLRQLRDPNQLTHLIKTDAVQIDGDIQIAQQFSNFFQQLNPDWQSHVARYLGDGLTHKLSLLLSQLSMLIQHKQQSLQQLTTELLQDELQLSPTSLEVVQFCTEVSQLHARLERLQQQLRLRQE
ncbi:SCP2 sterol-binding domain-containing protein [Alkalimonas delamerensis]|uniref:Ubiquinone biosynthesis accessory factor UbiJ n=1 Tax=Alkalimonas delamerensis TaxID=265981 RepID=A0ABT9GTK9_9GAMM|nr:SCP2 sterol-binding domain-containing protein [Alkalimonas delamerensis]MDP4530309.1 SCP2 sterol-binding domain-containing protein [Alkalimonas delamerensis]